MIWGCQMGGEKSQHVLFCQIPQLILDQVGGDKVYIAGENFVAGPGHVVTFGSYSAFANKERVSFCWYIVCQREGGSDSVRV